MIKSNKLKMFIGMSKFNFDENIKQIILGLIELKLPITEIARRIGCQYRTLKNFLKQEKIEYKGNPSRKGIPHIESQKNMSSEEYMKSVITPKNSVLIRLLSKERGYRKCEVCQNDKWNGKDIPLEIHHIDGNHQNRRVSNILMICPNCHAQTDNYKSKNMKKY